MAKAFPVAPPLLSNVVVDVDKDWATRRIENLGTPVNPNDAAKKDTVEILENYARRVYREKDIYSSDYGLKWADLGVIASGDILSMEYLGNGIAILGDLDWHIWRSVDYGLNWSDLGVIASDFITAMTNLGNGIVIVGDDSGRVYRSTDYGLTWADLGVIAAAGIASMVYLGNGIAILGSVGGHIWRSTNYGANWADVGAVSPWNFTAVAYLSNGIVIATTDSNIYRSTDYGLTWTDLGAIAALGFNAAVYLGDGIALVGDNAYVQRSTDYGLTWTQSALIGGATIFAAAYLGNGVVIMGDSARHIFRSVDYGVNWTDLGVIASGIIDAMAYLGNGIAILGDSTFHIYRSTSAFQLSNFNPNQFDKVFQFGCLGAITPNATSYLAPGNGATQVNEIRVRVPRPGILRNLFVWQRVASGAAGRTDIYTVRVNGANTAITCTLNNQTEGANIVNAVVVAAGDQVSIRLVSNNAADTSADVVAVVELV